MFALNGKAVVGSGTILVPEGYNPSFPCGGGTVSVKFDAPSGTWKWDHWVLSIPADLSGTFTVSLPSSSGPVELLVHVQRISMGALIHRMLTYTGYIA